MHVINLFLTRQIPLYLKSYFNVKSVVIIWCFITSYDIHLSHCVYTIVVCSVFIIMLQVFYFIKKQNVRAFTIILGVTMKAVLVGSLLLTLGTSSGCVSWVARIIQISRSAWLESEYRISFNKRWTSGYPHWNKHLAPL